MDGQLKTLLLHCLKNSLVFALCAGAMLCWKMNSSSLSLSGSSFSRDSITWASKIFMYKGAFTIFLCVIKKNFQLLTQRRILRREEKLGTWRLSSNRMSVSLIWQTPRLRTLVTKTDGKLAHRKTPPFPVFLSPFKVLPDELQLLPLPLGIKKQLGAGYAASKKPIWRNRWQVVDLETGSYSSSLHFSVNISIKSHLFEMAIRRRALSEAMIFSLTIFPCTWNVAVAWTTLEKRRTTPFSDWFQPVTQWI